MYIYIYMYVYIYMYNIHVMDLYEPHVWTGIFLGSRAWVCGYAVRIVLPQISLSQNDGSHLLARSGFGSRSSRCTWRWLRGLREWPLGDWWLHGSQDEPTGRDGFFVVSSFLVFRTIGVLVRQRLSRSHQSSIYELRFRHDETTESGWGGRPYSTHRAHPLICHDIFMIIYSYVLCYIWKYTYCDHRQKVAAKVLAACYGFTLQAWPLWSRWSSLVAGTTLRLPARKP